MSITGSRTTGTGKRQRSSNRSDEDGPRNHLQWVRLDEPDALDQSIVGAKAAGLARLLAAGFDVPDAVVLPVGIASMAGDGSLPERLAEELPAALGSVGEPVAVRSSATWEDSSTSAHAGATVTELGLAGVDDVGAAIQRCIDGTLSAQLALGVVGDVALIIQRLVPARFAGVAFTADPLTGERDVVRIAATEGLGEALVQGEVTGSDLTVRGTTIEGDLAGMDRDQVLELARVARDIEVMAGTPQDIEWAFDQNGLRLLQTRDITVLPVRPRSPEGNNWQKDLAHYPEPMTPFGWSAIQLSSDEVRSVFDEMGLLVRGLEEQFVGGEIYGRVLPAFGSANDARKPPPPIVLGLAARVVPELRRRNATARRVLSEDLPSGWVRQWHQSDRDDLSRATTELGAVDLSGLDDREMLEHLDRCIALTRRGIRIHFRLVMPMAHALYELHQLVAEELGWDDSKMATMLAGHSPATRAAEVALARIRERVRGTPGALAALELSPDAPLEALAGVDPGVAEQLQGWLAEHGWAMVNYDAGVPVLAERPRMICRLLGSDPQPVDLTGSAELAEEALATVAPDRRDEFDRALRRAREIYPLREDNTIVAGDRPLALLRRWMLEVSGRLAQRGVLDSGEDAVYLEIEELRYALIGEGLDDIRERIRVRRGEEAWVRANPGPGYIGEQGQPPDTSRLPEPLRRVNEPVLWIIGHEYPPPVEPPADSDVLLAGVAASAGVAEGPARIITSHHDMDRLQEGDVLVCQVTTPSWAPVFPLAAAVIADGGGVLSHAAIAARENGLPAVLGASGATSTLTDGQMVRVDGTRGLVLTADP